MTLFNIPEGGEAIIIKSKNKAVLIDAGGGKGDINLELGKDIRRFLTKSHTKLDAIVASHNHEDHLNAIVPMLKGGRNKILKDSAVYYHNGEVRNDSFYDILMDKLTSEGIKILEFGNWTLDYIKEWNGKQDIAMFTAKVSDSKKQYRSIVMHVPYGDASFLFTGDIYMPYENRLIGDSDFFQYIKTDVLKITHHGSNGGTGKNFLKYSSPGIFVSSSASDDNHKLDPKVIKRISDYAKTQGLGVKNDKFIFDTAKEGGDIIIRTDGVARKIGRNYGILFEVEIHKPNFHSR